MESDSIFSEPIYVGRTGRCQQCMKEKVTLKRCGGCTVVAYCSKECQKAAWPVHKTACRANKRFEGVAGPLESKEDLRAGEILRSMRYPSLSAIVQAMDKWYTAHTWPLLNMAEALLYLKGHTRADIEKLTHSGWRLAFILVPGEQDPAKRTPTNAFRIETYEFGRNSQQTNEGVLIKSLCNAEEHVKAQGYPFCILPVGFYLKDTGMAIHRFPYLLHAAQDKGSLPTDANHRGMLAELAVFSKASVNSGTLSWRLEICVLALTPLPTLGELVKVKKKWDWRPLAECGDWDAVEEIIALRVGYKTTTGLPLRAILTVQDRKV